MGSHGLACAMISILLFLVFRLELVGARVLHRQELQMIDHADTVVPPPEMVGTCASVIIPKGYKCEEHEVTTEDGYILSIQRIPLGRIGGGGGRRQPVLLQHGVLMGTLIALASFSEGKLVDKIKSAALLSPVAYLSHMTTPIGILAARAFVDQNRPQVAHFLAMLCRDPGVDCYNLLQSFTGIDSFDAAVFLGNNCCLNTSTVELFLEYEPQSTATRTMVHLAQTFREGIITKYNYQNREINIEYYGQSTPPIYNMSNIPNNLPLFLSYGGRDSLSDVHDVELLLDNLKFHDGDKLTVQFVENYAHADFVMAVDAAQIVYNAVMAFFNRE
ncbi:hypothetical protein COCNU_02G008700 [Cocos nucifera]|uniref:Partial AB-hydrolase lipase domain-containing protein n=1 Tax=Cocos nucifera TaxID=13894 RepID=A0A8K0HZL1_COCNU|nr:hypothetical protein COCNU_02G008700 [Cocos nucifera]